MTKEQTRVGVMIRVIGERYDAPAGTVARIEHVGRVGTGLIWCFNVRWLNRERTRSKSDTSLNLSEEDLQDFEVHTGPVEQPPNRNLKHRRALIVQRSSEQLCLPYGCDDTIPERPADRYFHLRTRTAWNFDVDADHE